MPGPSRPTREQMIKDLQASESARPSREQMISDLGAPRGVQVYDKPAGPEQASSVDRFLERVQDPQRWQAILTGKGPYAPKVVQGDAPLVLPGGAIPKLTKAAVALAEGNGLGYAAGRTALSAGQGAAMSAMGGSEDESLIDKIDRVKSGAKLSGGIQLAAESLPVVGKVAGYAARKIGSAVSGVDESIIKNYANRTNEVNDLIKQSGGDITTAADQVRTELAAGIQNTKSGLNAKISRTLKKSAPEATIPIQPLIDALQAAKSKLNPNFKAGAITEIDEMIAALQKEGKDGVVNASSLYQIKQYLNEGASSAYNKGGQIFTRASEAARAAKDAADEARGLLKKAAPEISKADGQLSRLHAIERRLNKNLLAPGKPDGALMAAGAGTNPRNAANLRALEDVSGVPVTQRARDLATAKTFANPSLTPTDWTGKAAARVLIAGGIGSAAAGPIGAAVGAGLTSPMAVKLGVNTLNIAKDVAARFPSFGKFTRENPVAAQAVVQLLAGQIRSANETPAEITPAVEEYFQQNPKLMQDVQDPKVRADLEKRVAPKRGEDRWATRGAENLEISGETRTRLMNSKEGKRLLIEASDLAQGSRALEKIKDQIQKGWNHNGNDVTSGTPSKVLRHEREPAGRR